jgi:transposase
MYEVRGVVASKLLFHGDGLVAAVERSRLMSRMKIIALDVHCEFCEGGFIDSRGKELGAFRAPTCIPALVEEIEKVRRPRKLVMEEGALADWLSRSLAPYVDELVVCDPYRNALIAKESEKSDPIDWRKLAQLCRGGYLRAVHHPQTQERSALRQHVQLYHERVSRRVSEGHKIIWRARGMGVIVVHKDLSDADRRKRMLGRLPTDKTVQQDMLLLLKGFDMLSEQVIELRRRLVELCRSEPMIRRFCRVTGVKHVRAATFLAIVDTPFRFKSKQKLWKYLGIGLEKRHSGKGRVRLSVPLRCNRILKSVILGAAKSAIASGRNVFADQYQRWLDAGCSPRIAKRNVARSQAVVMWGMWKSQSDFDEQLVCRTTEALA